jgi:hypothetical protein
LADYTKVFANYRHDMEASLSSIPESEIKGAGLKPAPPNDMQILLRLAYAFTASSVPLIHKADCRYASFHGKWNQQSLSADIGSVAMGPWM